MPSKNGDEHTPTCGCAPNEAGTGRVLALAIMAADGAVDDQHVFGYVGLFFSLVLILRVVITIIRDGI